MNKSNIDENIKSVDSEFIFLLNNIEKPAYKKIVNYLLHKLLNYQREKEE